MNEAIQIHLADSKQLFSSIDPAPLREKDLDPKAEEFIVESARELPATAPLSLMILLDRRVGPPDEEEVLRDAVRRYFGRRSQVSGQRLRRLLKLGRTNLLIGTVFLTAVFGLGGLLERVIEGRLGELLREGLVIGGWVAMWRPLEILLYDWWPIRQEGRLYGRLGAMPVRVRYADSPPVR